MFSRIARDYDRQNSLLSFGMHHRWRRFTIRQCHVPPGGLALDVATGTADLAIEAAGQGARALGVDPCEPMLVVGAEKLRRAGLEDRVRLVAGEAEALPVTSGSFDCATIGFGLRNVTDIDLTFAEMARAVRPGGRVAALEIAKPRGAFFRPFFLFYFYYVSPRLARLFGGDPQAYQYLPGSLKRFQTREQLADSMRRAGLTDVRIFDLSGGSVSLHVATRPAGEPEIATR